ncbi:hypothetical protein DFP73DRAFT_523998 [Morchella snyderi]|nr:hypothetical protein DFP73DRAFT_523998 [Morchella snyderi]
MSFLQISSNSDIYIEISILFTITLFFVYAHLRIKRLVHTPGRRTPREIGTSLKATNDCIRHIRRAQLATQYKIWLDKAFAQIEYELLAHLTRLQNPKISSHLPIPDPYVDILTGPFPKGLEDYGIDCLHRLKRLLVETYELEGSFVTWGQDLPERAFKLSVKTSNQEEVMWEHEKHLDEFFENFHHHSMATDEHTCIYDSFTCTDTYAGSDSGFRSRSSDDRYSQYEDAPFMCTCTPTVYKAVLPLMQGKGVRVCR